MKHTRHFHMKNVIWKTFYGKLEFVFLPNFAIRIPSSSKVQYEAFTEIEIEKEKNQYEKALPIQHTAVRIVCLNFRDTQYMQCYSSRPQLILLSPFQFMKHGYRI